MQSITGKVHGLRCPGFIEPGENVFHGVEQIGTYHATVCTLIKPFEAAMLEAPDHQAHIKCKVYIVTCQSCSRAG